MNVDIKTNFDTLPTTSSLTAESPITSTEMAVLVAGLRVLDANTGRSQLGVFTDTPGHLTNDFFVNLLDMRTVWTPADDDSYEGRDRATGALRWSGSRVDLVFGSNSELRAIAEVGSGGSLTHDSVAPLRSLR